MLDVVLGATFGGIGFLFLILAFLVFRQGKNEINLTFILGVSAFAIGAFICSLSFFELIQSEFGLVGNTVMLWGPVGILFSAKFILYGIDDRKSLVS
jgi:hypothetical protein